MKILLIHPDNLKDYQLGRLVNDSIEYLKMGCQCFKYEGADEEFISEQLETLSCDADIAIILKGESLTRKHLRKIHCPIGIWHIGALFEVDDHLKMLLEESDCFFTTCYDFVKKAKEINPESYWVVEGAYLPLLKPQEVKEEDKTYEVSFCGLLTMPPQNLVEKWGGDKQQALYQDRNEYLSSLDNNFILHAWGPDKKAARSFKNYHGEAWNDDLAELVSKSKIVFGDNSRNDLQLYWSNRVYVTLALKGFFVTPYIPGMEEVFQNHEEIVWFHNVEELKQIVDFYLERPEERKRIAENGYKKVLKLFSLQNQVRRVLRILGNRQKKRLIRALFIEQEESASCRDASANYMSFLNKLGVICDLLEMKDETFSTEILDNYDFMFFNSYSETYNGLLSKFKGDKYFFWHSSLFQTQVEEEIKFVRMIKKTEERGEVKGVICSDEDCTPLFKNGIYSSLFQDEYPKFLKADLQIDKDKFNIAVLASSKIRKNFITAMTATNLLGDEFHFHINVTEEFYNENVAVLFDEDKITNHGWLTKDDYFTLIRQCDCLIQLSVGESYDYVAAQSMSLGTPVISSCSVKAVPVKELRVKDHENVGELLNRIEMIKRSEPWERKRWKERFKEHNEMRKRKARATFNSILGIRIPQKPLLRQSLQTKPTLSIVFHARKDLDDFRERLTASIYSAKLSFARLNPEIILVDWNRKRDNSFILDEGPLRKIRKGMKTYVVSSEINKKLNEMHGTNENYMEWYAKNVGVRRAKGEYILCVNSNNVFNFDFSYEDLPDEYTTLMGKRIEIRQDFFEYDVEEAMQHLENGRFINGERFPINIKHPGFISGPCGEFVLSHRDNWHMICGHVETPSSHINDNILVAHFRKIGNLEFFKEPIYHLEQEAEEGVFDTINYEIGHSGPNWGLANVHIDAIET